MMALEQARRGWSILVMYGAGERASELGWFACNECAWGHFHAAVRAVEHEGRGGRVVLKRPDGAVITTFEIKAERPS